ncbi:hypothetical protein PspLS_10700 [Pyricularia sp. CBS 133598]|nr:hypothetical protein PspLS_10700 [Pyricularia sp. CBS 133598]
MSYNTSASIGRKLERRSPELPRREFCNLGQLGNLIFLTTRPDTVGAIIPCCRSTLQLIHQVSANCIHVALDLAQVPLELFKLLVHLVCCLREEGNQVRVAVTAACPCATRISSRRGNCILLLPPEPCSVVLCRQLEIVDGLETQLSLFGVHVDQLADRLDSLGVLRQSISGTIVLACDEAHVVRDRGELLAMGRHKGLDVVALVDDCLNTLVYLLDFLLYGLLEIIESGC